MMNLTELESKTTEDLMALAKAQGIENYCRSDAGRN